MKHSTHTLSRIVPLPILPHFLGAGPSRFSCEVAHCRQGLIAIFWDFVATINKIFILAGGLGTRLLLYEI